jgi:hypothetical protein
VEDLHLCLFFSHHVDDKFSYALPDMSYFYDLKNHGTLGILNKILWDTGRELFKTDQTRTVQGKLGRMGYSLVLDNHL